MKTLLLLLLLTLIACVDTGSNNKTENNNQQSEQLTIEGSFAGQFLNLLLPSAHASTSFCQSRCTQESCVDLYAYNGQTAKDDWLCSTNLESGDQFQFKISRQDIEKPEILTVKKSSDDQVRISTFVVTKNQEKIYKDLIDENETLNSLLLKEKIKEDLSSEFLNSPSVLNDAVYELKDELSYKSDEILDELKRNLESIQSTEKEDLLKAISSVQFNKKQYDKVVPDFEKESFQKSLKETFEKTIDWNKKQDYDPSFSKSKKDDQILSKNKPDDSFEDFGPKNEKNK